MRCLSKVETCYDGSFPFLSYVSTFVCTVVFFAISSQFNIQTFTLEQSDRCHAPYFGMSLFEFYLVYAVAKQSLALVFFHTTQRVPVRKLMPSVFPQALSNITPTMGIEPATLQNTNWAL